jgi:hypothetical protein
MVERLANLLDEGTITVDHLIESVSGRTREKGPLFKIAPSNMQMLFGELKKLDLLS